MNSIIYDREVGKVDKYKFNFITGDYFGISLTPKLADTTVRCTSQPLKSRCHP